MNLSDAIGLYNYWVVVFLMMTGFYIVIASRNLTKSIIGLNIFQTSVFLLYITMGKIDGATTPIIPPEIAKAAAAHGHGHAPHHGESAELTHTTGAHDGDATDHSNHGVPDHHESDHHESDDHPAASEHHGDDHSEHGQADHGDSAHGEEVAGENAPHHDEELLHDDHQTEQDATALVSPVDTSYQGLTGVSPEKIIYSNPLPSVLMLTAIVVGIATTSLALALIVRIREDYGTVEEDEIMELDRAS